MAWPPNQRSRRCRCRRDDRSPWPLKCILNFIAYSSFLDSKLLCQPVLCSWRGLSGILLLFSPFFMSFLTSPFPILGCVSLGRDLADRLESQPSVPSLDQCAIPASSKEQRPQQFTHLLLRLDQQSWSTILSHQPSDRAIVEAAGRERRWRL